MNTAQLIEIRHSPDELKKVYQSCKPNCFAFMAKCFGANSMDDTEMFTIFNDAIIVLYEKLDDPSFKLASSVQTYLNSVCRNMALSYFKKNKRLYRTTDVDIENLDFNEEITDVLEELPIERPYEVAIRKALKVIRERGGNCADILIMFWYHKASMKDIAQKFGYTNASNAKNQKARCQKRLKDIALQLVKI